MNDEQFRGMYFDRDGKEMGLMEWAEKLEHATREERTVNFTELPNGYVVSTVWVGLNMNYGGGTPLIFETGIMHGSGRSFLEVYDRWATEEEALQGHGEAVKEFGSAQPPEE